MWHRKRCYLIIKLQMKVSRELEDGMNPFLSINIINSDGAKDEGDDKLIVAERILKETSKYFVLSSFSYTYFLQLFPYMFLRKTENLNFYKCLPPLPQTKNKIKKLKLNSIVSKYINVVLIFCLFLSPFKCFW